MIYVTGDIHGSIDIRKLLKNNITEKITEEDYVIICGDFGLVWHYKKEIRKEKKWLDWLNKQRWTTIFVDGNHECFPRLNAFPVKDWHGGKVHVIRDKVLHLMRGEIFEIEGNRIFAMGGAASHDRGPAKGDTDIVIGKSWWPEEIPSREEMDHALENLAKYDFKVDYIITHCLPTLFQDYLKHGEYASDDMTRFLDIIFEKAEYKHWYSGHYHYNVDVTDRISVVFSRILTLGQNIRESDTVLGVPKFRREEVVLFDYQGEPMMGMITDILPWGPFGKHDEPYYEILVFADESINLTISESQVYEKSLIK